MPCRWWTSARRQADSQWLNQETGNWSAESRNWSIRATLRWQDDHRPTSEWMRRKKRVPVDIFIWTHSDRPTDRPEGCLHFCVCTINLDRCRHAVVGEWWCWRGSVAVVCTGLEFGVKYRCGCGSVTGWAIDRLNWSGASHMEYLSEWICIRRTRPASCV